MDNIFVSAVVVAAGNSSRMGLKISKQFIDLGGEPVIAHTLRAFERSDVIDGVVVVCRENDKMQIENIVSEKGFNKVRATVLGGATRDESVRNGVFGCDERTPHFAIHDGARPLISQDDIKKVVACAVENGCAVLGTFVTDTIKVVNDKNEIISTPERSTLRAVQTPQVFEKSIYLKALKFAKENKEPVTDDCKLVENIGEKIHIVLGSETNIKLTTQNDIKLARNILKEVN